MVRLTLLNKEMADVPVPLGDALELTFDDIANVPVADANSVSDWNTFFDLPTNGNPFTSVGVVGNVVTLIGGSNVNLSNGLFIGYPIVKVIDNGCLNAVGDSCFATGYGVYSITEFRSTTATSLGSQCFYDQYNLVTIDCPAVASIGSDCFFGAYTAELTFPSLITVGVNSFFLVPGLVTLNLPAATSLGDAACYQSASLVTINAPEVLTISSTAFVGCTALSVINIPKCTSLGGSVTNDGTFLYITGNTITLTIPSALMTCNGGNPDGDIQYLQANNTVTVITV